MPFNSISFIYFFGVFFPLYWIFKSKYMLQNLFLLIGNLYFYAQIDPKLCVLWLLIALVTWLLGMAIAKNSQHKGFFLLIGLLFIFSQLFIAKYYNWLFGDLTRNFGIYQFISTVGLSYYTLAASSYLIDLYRGKLQAEGNPITLGAYLSFFPQLLSGPIPIAYKDLAQYSKNRTLNWIQIEEASQRILWGIVKKVIISGMLAKPVDYIFYNHTELGLIYLWLAIILYSFQVYMDFSGYSDMAWGIAKLLGININPNFKSPFISQTIDEFWRRWHLSLSAWLKEYIYLPLGGRGKNKAHYMLNIFLVFFVSGLWHGANANYILWGSFNGILFVIAILVGWTRSTNNTSNLFKSILSTLLVFILIAFTRVFFRSPDFGTAILFYQEMFRFNDLSLPDVGLQGLFYSILLVIIEGIRQHYTHPADFSNYKLPIRLAVYIGVICLIYLGWPTQNPTEYIYFKF